MFKNYLKIAARMLIRNKVYSFINITGLAMGMAAFMLIALWVQNELSYDQFHEKKESLYRVVCDGPGGAFFGSPAPLAPTIESEVPEIIATTRFYKVPRFVFEYDNRSFYESNGIVVDKAFFQMFSFPFIKGSLESAFATHEHMIITESMAHKYFGTDNPINKKINVEGEGFMIVGGVIKDIPANSHLQFDYAVPYAFLENVRLAGLQWGDLNFKTYIQVQHPIVADSLDAKITKIAYNNNCPQIRYGPMTFFIQSLEDMYLHPVSAYDIPLGNIKYIMIFSLIALFILAIACINFINLSTARSTMRAKEVGIRKVVGAKRGQLMLQFWSEFMQLAVLALFVALLLVWLAMPYFNALTGKQLVLNLSDPSFLILILSVTAFCGFFAGFYPAASLSHFLPIKVLQKHSNAGSRSPILRRLMVIAQFSLSILLIICTLVVMQQMNFVQSKSWTIEDDLVLHIPIKENIGVKYDVVKNELLSNVNIVSVCAKDALPTFMNNNTTGVWWQGKDKSQDGIHMETMRVDYDYLTTMDLNVLQGRGFSKDRTADVGTAYILNKEAVRQAQLKDPVGKSFSLYGKQGTIIGIVEDSFFQSLKQANHPQVYNLFTNLPREGYFGSVFIRVANAQTIHALQETVAHIENVWNGVNKLAPFEYHFLDETIEAQYHGEQRLMKLFTIFASLAIFISCLGLFGLATFIAERRIKEIGIRKVLGSTVGQIVFDLSHGFAKWVLIANIFAWPIAWYVMHTWLQNFVFRIEMSVWSFVLAGLLALAIALITVSWQAIRAALANPVESLRYE